MFEDVLGPFIEPRHNAFQCVSYALGERLGGKFAHSALDLVLITYHLKRRDNRVVADLVR